MTIEPPRHAPDHPDRFIDCQEALEPGFQALVWEAMKVGWGEAEAVAAIVELADAHALAMGENQAVEDILKRLRP